MPVVNLGAHCPLAQKAALVAKSATGAAGFKAGIVTSWTGHHGST